MTKTNKATAYITTKLLRFNTIGFPPPALRQSILYALAIFLSKGIGLIMIPVFTHFLEPADYGRLDILQTLADVLSIVLIMGLGEAIFKFYGNAETAEQQDHIIGNIMGVALCITVGSVLVLQFCASLIHDLLPGDISLWQARLLLFTLSLSTCLVIPLCWYRLKGRAKEYFYAASGRVALQALISALLLYAGFGVTGVMAAGAVASMIWGAKMCVDILRVHRLRFDMHYWRMFFAYGAPLIVTGIAGFVLGSFDRWILAVNIGASDMALYALAAKFGLLTFLFVQPFDLWWQPKRFQVLRAQDGASQCAKHISTGMLIICTSVICVSTMAPLVIIVMTPLSYHGAVVYVPLLSLLAGIHAMTQMVNIGIYNVKITKWPAIIDMSAAGVAYIGYITLIPLYGAWGAIMATAIALILRLGATLYLSQKLSYLPYAYIKMGGMLLFTLAAVLVLMFEGTIILHFVRGALLLGALISYGWYFGLITFPDAMRSRKGRVLCS